MSDLAAIYEAFREAGYCTDCWVSLNDEPHDEKCSEGASE